MMTGPAQSCKREIYLMPGDCYFGGPDCRITTLLGSCVSIAIWHPIRKAGGMCHYMLPFRHRRDSTELDGRFADDAMELILAHVRRSGATPGEFEIKIMGGGRICQPPAIPQYFDIGQLNIEQGRALLTRHGFCIKGEHVAGRGHRKVVFDVETGRISLHHLPGFPITGLSTRIFHQDVRT